MSIPHSRFIAGLILAALCPAASGDQSAYEAVTTTRVKVRSGPSENHYATCILDRDTHVMVLREEPNGWLAIEPPEGSFSWISGQYVREISPTEGEATGDNVVVRIGTLQDERQRDVIQKKLNRGDRVRILDKSTSGQGPLTKISYKIAPPAGEVRFVSAQYVQPVSAKRPAAPKGVSETAPRSSAAPQPRPAPSIRDADDETDEELEAVAPSRVGGDQSPHDPLERANAAYEEMMKESLADRDIEQVLELYEQAANSAASDADRVHVARRLEVLDAQKIRQERLAEIDRLYRRAKQRDEALLSIPRRKSEEVSPESAESAVPRYDASGILRRSTVILDGKPAYGLVSPQGGIRYYVTASPGIDLKKYLDRIVAVRGPASYRIEIRAHHIVVRDITVIELGGRRDAAE